MKTITLRHLPKPLARILERRARNEKSSLNRAAIRLMEESVGLAKRTRRRYHDMDQFVGIWSKSDAVAFDASLRAQRKIDPELWR